MNAAHVALLMIGLALPAWSSPLMESVPVKLGPKAFRDGDVIQILEVESTSPELEQGDLIVVRGRYRLESQPSAILSLYLTQTESGGGEETEETQTVNATSGWHDFELSMLIKRRGLPHLTFYRTGDGRPFGGVYFGTLEQMANADGRLVEYYEVGEARKAGDSNASGLPDAKEPETKPAEPVKAVKLKYEYGFSPEVDALMQSVEESDPNRERHPKVRGGTGEEVPAGDFHRVWPPQEFRLENGKPEGEPIDPPNVELPLRHLQKTP